MNPRTPVPAAMGGEQSGDLPTEFPVLLRASTHRPAAPGVEPGARDPVELAEARHREPAALGLNEGKGVGLRAEQNRMAFFRSACSS